MPKRWTRKKVKALLRDAPWIVRASVPRLVADLVAMKHSPRRSVRRQERKISSMLIARGSKGL